MSATRLIFTLQLDCLSIIQGHSSEAESFHVARRSNDTLSAGSHDLWPDDYTFDTGLPGNQAAYIDDVELQNSLKMQSGTAVNC